MLTVACYLVYMQTLSLFTPVPLSVSVYLSVCLSLCDLWVCLCVYLPLSVPHISLLSAPLLLTLQSHPQHKNKLNRSLLVYLFHGLFRNLQNKRAYGNIKHMYIAWIIKKFLYTLLFLANIQYYVKEFNS